MNNEDNIIKARLMDLAKKAYNQNIYTYSPFLNPAELSILDEIKSEISYVDYETFGGTNSTDRQLVGFGSERMFGYEGTWPISIIMIKPLIDKFSDDLTHRDILGSLMNLGIERNVIGDILIKEKRAYVFALDNMAEYICDNLTKIKHTSVMCSVISANDSLEELKPTLVDVNVIAASERFDAIIAVLTKKSRSDVINFFQGRLVTLNGRICERNSMTLKEGDVFSVRGYGKYVYLGEESKTRKGRIYIKLKEYK